jgi:probable HAF family extracellular repeat protein
MAKKKIIGRASATTQSNESWAWSSLCSHRARLVFLLTVPLFPIVGLTLSPGDESQIPETYAITDLSQVSGSQFRVFTALGANGQLTGNFFPPGALVPHAFLYDAGTIGDLGTLPALGTSSSTLGTSINASAQVAGNAVGSQTQHSFLTVGSTLTDLGFLPGGAAYSGAAGVNALGQVTGYSFTTSTGNYAADYALRHAYIYANGALTDLGTLQAGGYSYGTAINDSGQVVGGASVAVPAGAPPGNYEQAFLYSGGVMIEYPLPKTYQVLSSYVTAINSAGVAVGSVVVASPGREAPTTVFAASFSPAIGVTSLGFLGNPSPGGTTALGINQSGTIVGTSDGAAFATNQSGALFDLNILLDPTDPLAPMVHLTLALAINDAGAILAQANVGSVTHYLLLVTQPLVFVPVNTGFSDTVVGMKSVPQLVTVTNLGSSAVTLAGFSVIGDFSLSGNTCAGSLAGGAQCSISVAFTPTTLGTRNGTITFTSSGATHIYQLEGAGIFVTSLKNMGPGNPTVGQPFTLVWSSIAGAVCVAAGGGPGDGWDGAVLSNSGSKTLSETTGGTLLSYALTCSLDGVGETSYLDLMIGAATPSPPPSPPSPTHSGGGQIDPVTLLILAALGARRFARISRNRRS